MKHVEPDDFISHLRSFQGGLERTTRPGKVSMAYTVLTPKPGLVPGFLRWVLKSNGYIQELRTTTNQLRDGQSIKFINIARVALPLPAAEEQRAIAAFLDRETAKIDTLIAKQEHLIATLRERRSSVIARHILGDREPLLDQRGFVSLRVWFGVTLGKMLDAGRTRRSDDVVLPYMRAANIQPEGLDLTSVNSMPFTSAEATVLDLRRGDLMVVEGGAGFGNAVVLQEDYPAWSFQKTLNRIRPTSDASPDFLALVLRVYRDTGVLDIVCNKSTIPHLTAEKLLALPVPDIEPNQQHEVSSQVRAQTMAIDTLIAKAEEFIAVSKERRSALITAAVTGQIDMRVKAA